MSDTPVQGTISLGLFECERCGALLTKESAQIHADWHSELELAKED